MKTMDILEALNDMDSRMLQEAQIPNNTRAKPIAKIILVAALVALLAVSTVAAVETINWFADYFGPYANQELSGEQLTFIDENTTQLLQSKTCNGYTITVESAISDGTTGYIKLSLAAPEGVILDATNYFPGNDEYLTTVEEGKTLVCGGGWGVVEDHDGKANTTGIVCHIRNRVQNRTQWKLNVVDIMQTREKNIGQPDYEQWIETVAEGTWSFDIVFSDGGKEEKEFISEPVITQVNLGLGGKGHYKDVRITSVKLKALSGQITYEYLEPTHGAGDLDAVYVIMRDGSQVMMLPASGTIGQLAYEFSAPIILENVDHILLPDGQKLPAPEQ